MKRVIPKDLLPLTTRNAKYQFNAPNRGVRVHIVKLSGNTRVMCSARVAVNIIGCPAGEEFHICPKCLAVMKRDDRDSYAKITTVTIRAQPDKTGTIANYRWLGTREENQRINNIAAAIVKTKQNTGTFPRLAE